MEFEGKVAIVTGGNSGIGEAVAWRFAEGGAKVVIIGNNPETCRAKAEALRAAGHEVAFHAGDVSREADVKAAVDLAVGRFGRLDFAINSAGIYQNQPCTVVDMEADYFDRIVAINLRGIFLSMKYQIAAMLKSGGGSVVNVASGAGIRAVPFASGYVAAKHGVIGLTKTAAYDFGTQGVRVNAICPGLVKTAMTGFLDQLEPEAAAFYFKANTMERIGLPEEIASAAAWLCSEGASFTTGLIMPVDGGYSVK
ncbi:SDR family NAD(P)-dependent oxidoreductase [Flavisphingomonas formosensis]|uniref:SDR family NAD(P)-dependent oxidoreductase n=1 Tax=Flavisphingomonas formosensis TaxID=861534 RepID=UPI0012F8BF19|nr:glucose 1-dehydrogenase [Sphingomonas formosensis]